MSETVILLVWLLWLGVFCRLLVFFYNVTAVPALIVVYRVATSLPSYSDTCFECYCSL